MPEADKELPPEALRALAEADDVLDTLERHFGE